MELYAVWSNCDGLICVDEKVEAEKEYNSQLNFFKQADSDEIDIDDDMLIFAKIEKLASWEDVDGFLVFTDSEVKRYEDRNNHNTCRV
ncbi:hypothetical protein NU07_00465 [Listeria monocytogenes]|nr:hypothetical protein [Listeria monocytogenes]